MTNIVRSRPADREPRFLANASAVAFGGEITRIAKAPTDDPASWKESEQLDGAITLEGASCALPINGGRTFHSRRNAYSMHFGRTLSRFGAATAETWLQKNDNDHVTHARSSAANVSIGLLEPIQFPICGVHGVSTHYGNRQQQPDFQLDIRFDGFYFKGKHHPIAMLPAPTTYARVQSQFSGAGATPHVLPESAFHHNHGRDIAVTLVENPDDYHWHIPEIGHLYFGELIVTEDERRFSLVRLELGSPMDGSAVITAIHQNGGTFP